MKILIASDIHGSAYYCRCFIERALEEKPDRILLLGDLLYHGPRNDLPREYAPKEVIAMLNGIREKLLCVRGNCDTEVDQMVLEFPILAEYCILYDDRRMIFATHGHKFHTANPPMLSEGDVLLHGHTHVPAFEVFDGKYYINPGSVSIPKEGSACSYLMLEDGNWTWKDVETGEIYRTEHL